MNHSGMSLLAKPKDAAQVAEIHMAAFGSNSMLQAMFPSAAIREDVQHIIEVKALADIQDTNTTVLIVQLNEAWARYGEEGSSDSAIVRSTKDTIIAYVKWAHPTESNKEPLEPQWKWPEGTALDVLAQWRKLIEKVQTATMGSQPCYRLTFIATDPEYQRRGAGRLLVAWGVDRCEKENIPAYLESTVEAVHLYKTMDFEDVGEISPKIDITTDEAGLVTEDYIEPAMVYRPQATKS